MIFNLVLNEQQDRDIIRWLNTQPKGRTSSAVRNALRRHMQQEQITLTDVYEAIMELKKRSIVATEPETNPDPHSEDPELASNLDRLLEL